MNKTINYQRIYEEEVSAQLKDSSERSDRFFELTHQDRLLVEELIDAGYRQALEDALDPEVMAETVSYAQEMGNQLLYFAEMLGKSFPTTGEDQ